MHAEELDSENDLTVRVTKPHFATQEQKRRPIAAILWNTYIPPRGHNCRLCHRALMFSLLAYATGGPFVHLAHTGYMAEELMNVSVALTVCSIATYRFRAHLRSWRISRLLQRSQRAK